MLNVLVLLILLFSYFLVGGLFPKQKPAATPGTSMPNMQCCDQGDGLNCKPVPGETINYNSATGVDNYGLLKSNVALIEHAEHIDPAVPEVLADGKPIFLNTSENKGWCDEGSDCIWEEGRAVPIADDLLIYVCLENCGADARSDGVFNVYIRLADVAINPPPLVIRSCKPPAEAKFTSKVVIQLPDSSEPPDETIQLKALTAQAVPRIPWISPHCKPAIYLYPEEKTDVNVRVHPKGKFTLTIPVYPENGWNVTAYPNGQIDYQNSSYDYLYYETQIPDTLIEKPTKGFVVAQKGLLKLFSDVLPKFGLNEKETLQFSEYWLKALPASPYYFVGVISTTNLEAFAPITIKPTPTTTIRVTLYFELLDEVKKVETPTIIPVTRNGFTAVEWGGIVKTDPLRPFSCFM